MKQQTLRLFCFVLLISQLSAFNFAQTAPEQLSQPLESDKPIGRELKGGEIHAYTIKPEAGQFAAIVVEQRGIDVVVTMFAPDNRRSAEVDSPNGSQGPERLSFVGDGAGIYRIEVRPLEKTTTGRYEIRIETLRAATVQEKEHEKLKKLAAALVFAETEELRTALLAKNKEIITAELVRELSEYGRRFRNQDNHSSALAASRFALRLAEQIGDKTGAADSIYNIGVVFYRQKDYAQALEYLQKSLQLRELLDDKTKTADSLLYLATLYKLQNNFAPALEYYERSLVLYQETGFKKPAADVLYNIGWIYQQGGKSTEALEAYRKALRLYQDIDDKTWQANALYSLGAISFNQGNFIAALEYHRKNLTFSEETGNKTQIAYSLNQMSLSSGQLGEFANAMEYVNQAFSISETLDSKELKAHIFMSYGLLYGWLGNRAKALEFYQKSLVLGEEINNKALIANALEKIGTSFSLQGKFAQAMECFQKSLKLNEEIGNKRQITYTTEKIGNTYFAQGNFVQAMEYYRKSLKLSEEIRNKFQVTRALNRIGFVYGEQGDYSQALEVAERAVTLSRQTGVRGNLYQALYIAALANRDLKQFEKSRQLFEEAISIMELSRATIAGQEDRTSFFAATQTTFELYIDLLMQMHQEQPNQGYDGLALQISERARARSLLDLLNESRTDIHQGVMPELLESERLLRKQLNARAEQQTRLLSGRYTPEQAAALEKEIAALTFEYRSNQAQIRLKSPNYAALTQPQPLKPAEIQNEILDTDTVILEYTLGVRRSFLWAVSKDSIKSFELPPRREIETSVRSVYAFLSDGKQMLDPKAQAVYETEAQRLSRILLAPVAAQIQNKRVVVVADGALQYLPFGALPSPNSKKNSPPLIVENEVVSLPSASTLAVLRRQVERRGPAAKTAAVLADPVFNSADERVKAKSPTNEPNRTTPDVTLERTTEALGVWRDGTISRLPFSRREAESILAVVPAGKKMQALDFEASRKTALSAEMSQYRIVHFATHGLLNSENPELSGIVLSLVDEQGQPVDGFLRLNEIYNLNLNADLVVLSACQTALGKEVRGEGLIGLTRGFMYAGSPRVVASLWKVDDVATAELMKIFYQKMLKENLTGAAALRAAKVEMRKQKRWSAPFYWAAFELQGEWR